MIPLSYNLRSILRRRVAALATALGLGLVVFVLAAVLMIAHGVEQTLGSTGSRNNAILLRKGSTAELTSAVPRDAAKFFAANPAVAAEGGRAVASPESLVIFQLARIDGNGTANVGIRGVTRDGWELLRSKEVRIAEGRLPQWGTSELLIGQAARGRYVGAEVGQTLSIARRQWQVVGVFDAHGTAHDSEVWGDADQIMDASRRTAYSSMTVLLRAPSDFATLAADVDADPRFTLEAKREDRYYAESSGALSLFIRALGGVIATFFAFGAVLGAMITMYAQVAARIREIGTLRALGFRRRAVLMSFLVEALLLAGAASVVGCLCASLLSAASFRTTNFSSFTEVKFNFHFDAAVAFWSVFWGLLTGLLGGALPALRAARMPIVEATKG